MTSKTKNGTANFYTPQSRSVETVMSRNGSTPIAFKVTEHLPRQQVHWITEEERQIAFATGIHIPAHVRFVPLHTPTPDKHLVMANAPRTETFGIDTPYLKRKLRRAMRFLRSGKHKSAPGHLVGALSILAVIDKEAANA